MAALLENRVAIVTGAARGIGLAVAQTLAMHGCKVVVADNGAAIDGAAEDPVAAEAAAERLNTLGSHIAVPFSESICAPGAAERMVALAVDTYGAVDIVINNATIVRPEALAGAGLENFQAVMDVNLTAPFALLAAAGPRMREQVQGGRVPGSIVNITSNSGLFGNPGLAAYAAAKAGLMGLTRVAAMEFAPFHIACNAVAPFAATRLTHFFQPADEVQTQYRERALKVPASYVANLVTWLASPQAAGITGQLFGVRGREVFVYSQSRPEREVFTDGGVLDADALGTLIRSHLAPHFTDLRTHREYFNTEPII